MPLFYSDAMKFDLILPYPEHNEIPQAACSAHFGFQCADAGVRPHGHVVESTGPSPSYE